MRAFSTYLSYASTTATKTRKTVISPNISLHKAEKMLLTDIIFNLFVFIRHYLRSIIFDGRFFGYYFNRKGKIFSFNAGKRIVLVITVENPFPIEVKYP